jgi:hypothetical protein
VVVAAVVSTTPPNMLQLTKTPLLFSPEEVYAIPHTKQKACFGQLFNSALFFKP